MDINTVLESRMTVIIIIGLIALIAISVIGVVWYRRSRTYDVITRWMAVWAAQGPFDSGIDSASAMRAASHAVLGVQETKDREDEFNKHAAAYDKDPRQWEELRAQAETKLSPADQSDVDRAKGYAAMEYLNREFLEEGGHKLEPIVDSDGNIQIAYKQTMSDEEIERKDQERNDRILAGIGEGLLSYDAPETQEFVTFLNEVGSELTDETPWSPRLIGRAYFACLDLRNDDPEDELAKEFERLNKAHIKANPAPNGEWSDTPGAHEEHLLRRRNNPYFPESRQVINNDELEHAKEQDIDEYGRAKTWLITVGSKIEALDKPVTTGQLNEIREELDDLLDYACSVGSNGADIRSTVADLRNSVIADMRAALEGDEGALAKLEEAEAYHQERMNNFGPPLIAQLGRENGPIPSDETIPALVSEDPETIASALRILPEETRVITKYHGLTLIREAFDGGYEDPDIERKIEVLGESEEND